MPWIKITEHWSSGHSTDHYEHVLTEDNVKHRIVEAEDSANEKNNWSEHYRGCKVEEVSSPPQQWLYDNPNKYSELIDSKRNNDWIDINLPWDIPVHLYKAPRMPDMTERIRQEFGTTQIDEQKKITHEEYNCHYMEVVRVQKNLNRPLAEEEFESKLREENASNPSVLKVLAYQALCRRIKVWLSTQPETIAYNKIYKEWEDEEKQKSFCGRGLNVPGTLIEIQDDDKNQIRTLLIGDINSIAEVGDDFAFSPQSQVIRYKIVWIST